MAKNHRNFGIAMGRLTKDPVIFDNKDGSKKVMVTLAIQDNFKGADGKKGSQFISFEAFVSAAKNGNIGPYAYMHKGDMVSFEYELRTNNYTDKDGNMVYGQVAQVQSVDLIQTKRDDAAAAAAPAVDEDEDAAFAE